MRLENRTIVSDSCRSRTRHAGRQARDPPRDQILYTGVVRAFWRDTSVGAQGDLHLEGLPFEPGQLVEVLVISKTAGPAPAGGRDLQDSVLEFRDPLEPVAGEEWDALQ